MHVAGQTVLRLPGHGELIFLCHADTSVVPPDLTTEGRQERGICPSSNPSSGIEEPPMSAEAAPAGGGGRVERALMWLKAKKRDEGKEGSAGAAGGYIFPSREAAAVALVTAACKSASRLPREELLFISASPTLQKRLRLQPRPLFTERGGRRC